MTTKDHKNSFLENLVELLELPDSAYEKAKKRYDDLGEWFDRKESLIKGNDPHIFPQGSFRLGTAIRPLNQGEVYDLDLACKLRRGITKDTHTQKQLKHLVGKELELYRSERGIKAPMEEKHRCWRLEYQDDLNFHMDIVPCIPSDEGRRQAIYESMLRADVVEVVADSVSQHTVAITDDRILPEYVQITEDWLISNPEGYAKWFEYRMSQQRTIALLEKAQVDEVPIFKRKSPLQRAVQLLKRHRDQMYKDNEDSKPISIIITTLAGRAHNGEQDIESTLTNILSKMGNLVNKDKPRVPNPVNPAEDFADRWSMPECRPLRLEENFFYWLSAAKSYFENILESSDATFISEQTARALDIKLDESTLRIKLGATGVSTVSHKPSAQVIHESSRPWSY